MARRQKPSGGGYKALGVSRSPVSLPRQAPHLLPLGQHPFEALRLLDEFQREREAGKAEENPSLLRRLRTDLRTGVLRGLLWTGPNDDAIGLLLWYPGSGESITLEVVHLAPAYARPRVLQRLLTQADAELAGGITRIRRVPTSIGTASLQAALEELGFHPADPGDGPGGEAPREVPWVRRVTRTPARAEGPR